VYEEKSLCHEPTLWRRVGHQSRKDLHLEKENFPNCFLHFVWWYFCFGLTFFLFEGISFFFFFFFFLFFFFFFFLGAWVLFCFSSLSLPAIEGTFSLLPPFKVRGFLLLSRGWNPLMRLVFFFS